MARNYGEILYDVKSQINEGVAERTCIDYRVEPDWKKLDDLAMAVDAGDMTKLDELVDLIIYEDETEKYMKYLRLAASKGSLAAKYECIKDGNDINLYRLFILRKAVKADIRGAGALRPDWYYEDALTSFQCAIFILGLMAAIGWGIKHFFF